MSPRIATHSARGSACCRLPSMLAKRFQDAAGLQAGEKTMISYLESLRGLAAESEGCVQAEINWFFYGVCIYQPVGTNK